MVKILGVAGSLRKGSYNAALLRAAVGAAPEGVELVLGTIRGVPLFDADEEALGLPPAVTALREGIRAADGLLIVSPEYNASIPGVVKNAVDWVSRVYPGDPSPFAGKPVAVMGASMGNFGTIQAQDAWRPVFKRVEAQMWFGGQVTIPRAQTIFDAEGTLTDEATVRRLSDFLKGFAGFVGKMRA
ncbi:NADPH-dependent FMN reductase [Neomegalonema sp.]|uniref:NADPH-dependent FMN reductase n=1 Tax=Neomegalonema sp. TaxID=2039713 RepID=UPI002633D485|nr:NADPH-dependent FMN reductase [Neomegalonema sp.]MDD2868281.1 NAD(P)H-dependent oxidoreductase [Neomegalonema sp.]